MNPSREELLAFDPHWCVYWANSFARSQLEIWLPLLQRSSYRFLVFLDGPGSLPTSVAALEADGRLLFAQSTKTDKRSLHDLPSLRGFLYVSNKNRIFGNVGEFRGHPHVFIGHGESAKASSGSRVAALYDSVFLAEYSGAARFPRRIRAHVRKSALAIGAPIVDGLVAGRRADRGTRETPVVLFAPTWEGHNSNKDYSSLPEVAPLLAKELAQGSVEVVLRPHPGNGKRSGVHRQAAADLWGAGADRPTSKSADANRADIMIGDLSGATSELLFTRKPMIIPVTQKLGLLEITARSVQRDYPWAYIWEVDKEPFADVLERAWVTDPLLPRRERSADQLFRAHRDIDQAARTFDIALGAVWNFRHPRLRRMRFETAMARRRRAARRRG